MPFPTGVTVTKVICEFSKNVHAYVSELRHEGPYADPRGVGLDDAEHVADEPGRHAQSGADAAYAAVARGHERVGACRGLK